MSSQADFQRDQVSDQLYRSYLETDPALLQHVQTVITPHAAALAGLFYARMLENPESKPYLNYQIVSERLHRSMTLWITELFLPSSAPAVADYMKRQRLVGEVHARINVPMKLVNHGIRLLKTEMGRLLAAPDQDPAWLCRALELVHVILDYSSGLINESYVIHHVDNQTATQALRLHLVNTSLVVELERLRSALFDWLRKTIMAAYQAPPGSRPDLPSVYQSDFALWVIYKADLVFAERFDLSDRLKSQLAQIQADLDRINQLQDDPARQALSAGIEALNESISRAAWLLGDFADQALEMEAGRDPLTRLFNRRFLPAVMQNMIKAARVTASRFAVLSCDLDGFKQINDRYGHEAGDKALTLFGDFIASQVRATDLVFRLGGDEFLVILAGADGEIGAGVAQKLLEQLQTRRFELAAAAVVELGMSIGIAESDGHPDYLRMLTRADEALYQAKSLGRNMYFVQPGDLSAGFVPVAAADRA